jgi:DNA repair protein RecN (Recombination protein N)
MLKSLKVQNYALIQHLSIDFEPDFSTLTGETGAGKSILLGALSLVLGSRADSTAINNQSDKCVVEAVFGIESYELQSYFDANDLDYQPETCIRREILNTGKSRAFINDTPVNLPQLKELATKLIDIHSQHENLELNSSQFQLNVLDAVAQNQVVLAQYKIEFRKYKEHLSQLTKLKEAAHTADADYDYNLFQLNQLLDLRLETIDQMALDEELQMLTNAEEIQQSLGLSFSMLSEGETNTLAQLKLSKQSLDKIKSYFPKAESFVERIETAFIDLKDLAAELEILAGRVEYNPERARLLKDQLDGLYSLMNKHQVNSVEGLLQCQQAFQAKVASKESYSIEIEKLEKAHQETLNSLKDLASRLTENRKKAVPRFTHQILIQLADLGMPHAAFEVEIHSDEVFNEWGVNRVGFLFSANKNQPPQNISKIASGGEISRLMLSIKSILSQNVSLPTIIFDEIDTGVSGEMADKMADIMKQMARNMQVISITHLPQIAARGKNHFKVYKIENNHTVTTQIQKLSADERIVEIARMLSGKDITKEAIENAKTLIAS